MVLPLEPGRLVCATRGNNWLREGRSAIGQPADLHIFSKQHPSRFLIAAEVANVNTTQLIGEVMRLYLDICPLKLLVLNNGIGPSRKGTNVPPKGKEKCEEVFRRLYSQDDIAHTPARVVWHDDETAIESALRNLLVLD